MIDAEQAWQFVRAHTQPGPVASRPLRAALHHYLAAPLRADRDIPACDRSAMDGYAVRAGDLAAPPVCLRVVAEVAAGAADRPAMAAGECVRIFTGANVPPDADTVVRVEDTEAAGESVRCLCPVTRGQHIFRRAENACTGDELLAAGTRLNAVHIGLCATVGCARPDVHTRPRVTILGTGDELKGAGDAVEIHEIRDSNGPMLAAALAAHHFPCVAMRTVGDDMGRLVSALQQALGESDVVLVSGGVSVGDYDLVPDAVCRAGGTIVYHGVQMKPGKPQLFAVFPSGGLVFGLPGNPLSVMVGLQELALPALRRLAGCPPDRCRPLLRLPLAAAVESRGARQLHVLARLVGAGAGTMVEPIRREGSADLVAASRADGAIRVPPDVTNLAAGTTVDFRPWELPA